MRKMPRHLKISSEIIVNLLIIISFVVRTTVDGNSLRLLHIIFRHGERSPTETYTNDPYKNYNWPEGWGALSNRGKQEMYNLGQQIRTNYSSYLTNYYFPKFASIESTFSERTQTSAQLLLAGLYPPVGQQIWNSDLLWQPIPVHYTPRLLDKKIAMRKKCPKYDVALVEAYNSETIKHENELNSKLYQYLLEHTGDKMNNITAVEFLYNTLEIQQLHSLELPVWVHSVYPNPMKTIAAKSLAIFTATDLMKRLKGGVLVKEMIDNMKLKLENKISQEIFLYSAHDVTIANVLRSLGFEELFKPGFGATVIVELHENYEIKILYKDGAYEDAHELEIKGCGKTCTLERFHEVLKSGLPADWELECQL